ncbi:Ribosomal RNA-processing protein 7 [Trapelia coarctata]|nr:Ribosomal RNA-processing protein 7 [Trapelia coarctata]
MAPYTPTTSPAIPLTVSDYHILPLSLPSLPALKSQPQATHYLYLHPHAPKIPSPNTSRSLFLVNVPFDATETHLKTLFSTQLGLPAGRMERVRFEGQKNKDRETIADNGDGSGEGALKGILKGGKKSKKRKRAAFEKEGELEDMEGTVLPGTWDREVLIAGGTAVVVFVDRVSMEAVVKAVRRARKGGERVVWGEGVEGKVPSLGSQRYLSHHQLRYPDKTVLLASVNAYMTAYASRESAKSRKLKALRQQPDEDGFITVTKGGRNKPAREEEAREKLEKQKERQKGLENFYRFQGREKRKERERELVRRFEEDKEKVRRMREGRGGGRAFKPE